MTTKISPLQTLS